MPSPRTGLTGQALVDALRKSAASAAAATQAAQEASQRIQAGGTASNPLPGPSGLLSASRTPAPATRSVT